MQWEGWRWATFWSVEWGCLKASGAEKPGAVKSSILWQRWGRGHLPLPGLRQRRAEMCTTNRRDAMVTWAGTCLGLDVIFLPSISNILGGLLRAGKGLTVLEAHFTLLFIPSLWHRCYAILFVNGSCVLNLPRHLVLLQLVPLTPSAISALLLLPVLGQPMHIFPNSISLYFLITQTNLSLYLPTVTGFSVLLITPACQLSKKITYALKFPLTLINEWLQSYITCLCSACALLVWTLAIL